MNLSSGVRLRGVRFAGTEILPGLLIKAQYVQTTSTGKTFPRQLSF